MPASFSSLLYTFFYSFLNFLLLILSFFIIFQAQSPTMARTKCFPTIDAYCRLIALLVKHSGDNTNSVTKINLLNRVSILEILSTVLLK